MSEPHSRAPYSCNSISCFTGKHDECDHTAYSMYQEKFVACTCSCHNAPVRSRAPGAIPANQRDRADEVIGRALQESHDLRTVLEAMAEYEGAASDDFDSVFCDFCHREASADDDILHTGACPVTKARRLLGKE